MKIQANYIDYPQVSAVIHLFLAQMWSFLQTIPKKIPNSHFPLRWFLFFVNVTFLMCLSCLNTLTASRAAQLQDNSFLPGKKWSAFQFSQFNGSWGTLVRDLRKRLGYFHNTLDCQACAVDHYQNKEAQTSCVPSPSGTSTSGALASRWQKNCEDH